MPIQNRYKTIRTLNDFPAPVAGVITLENNVPYLIQGSVSLGTNRIVLGTSNTILGMDKSDDKLIYTGTSALFTGTNKDFSLRYITISTPIAGASVFNLTGTNTNNFEFKDNIFGGCKSLGIIDGFNVLVFQKNFITLCDQGIQIGTTASDDLIIIDNYIVNNTNTVGCKFFDILTGASLSDIVISRNYFGTQSNETAINVGTITLTEYGKMLDNTFHIIGTSVVGVSYASTGWLFQGNSDVLNTVANGQIGFVDNATTTSVNNTFISIAGTWVLKTGANKFDSPSNGILRYIDKEPATLRLVANLCAFGASSYTCEMSMYKNGVLQNESKMGFTIYTAREFVTITFLDNNAVQNDQYELRIRKTTAGAVTTTVIDTGLSAFKL
jgi:hypothetical protein